VPRTAAIAPLPGVNGWITVRQPQLDRLHFTQELRTGACKSPGQRPKVQTRNGRKVLSLAASEREEIFSRTS
jgi:hypothetical protein